MKPLQCDLNKIKTLVWICQIWYEGVPQSVVPTTPPAPRTTKRTSAESRSIIPDELAKWKEMDGIPDFQTMRNEIRRKTKEFEIPLFVHADLEDQIIVQTVEFVEWKEPGVPRFLIKKIMDQSFQSFHFWG